MVIANEARTEDEVLDYGDLSIFVEKVVVSWLGESSIDFTETGEFTVTGMPQSSCC